LLDLEVGHQIAQVSGWICGQFPVERGQIVDLWPAGVNWRAKWSASEEKLQFARQS